MSEWPSQSEILRLRAVHRAIFGCDHQDVVCLPFSTPSRLHCRRCEKVWKGFAEYYDDFAHP